jgi:hypothetical protein
MQARKAELQVQSATLVPPDWGSLGIEYRGAGFFGVGGEVGWPAAGGALVGADGNWPPAGVTAAPCKVISWQGNISVWVEGNAEILYGIWWTSEAWKVMCMPKIIKCQSTGLVAYDQEIDFHDLDCPCLDGKFVLHAEALSEKGVYSFEMQSVLKTIPL